MTELLARDITAAHIHQLIEVTPLRVFAVTTTYRGRLWAVTQTPGATTLSLYGEHVDRRERDSAPTLQEVHIGSKAPLALLDV